MPFSIVKIVRVVMAVALALWVAGAGCLLGCEGMIAAAASEGSGAEFHAISDPNVVVSGDACASAKSHDCCKKTKRPAKTNAAARENHGVALVHTGPSSTDMSACPLAMSRATVIAKVGGHEENSTTAVSASSFSIQNFVEQTTPLATQVRMPNRGHTYLRCCSFLI